MKFIAEIDIMPMKALLDPQGKAVSQTLQNIGHSGISNVRIGKHVQIEFESENEDSAKLIIDEICKKVLINPIMEGFEFTIKSI